MEVSMKVITLVLSAVLLLGCTVSLTPQERNIRVTSDANAVKGCEYKGTVKGMDNWGGPLADSRQRAIDKMVRSAYLLGGDTVFQRNIYIAYNEFHALGEAFDCSRKRDQAARSAK